MTLALPTELRVLAWSLALFLVHLVLQGVTALRDRGIPFNAGPRDDPAPLGKQASRAQRAFDNFKETYPVFLALALALVVTGRNGGLGAIGAWLWLAARLLYVPLYLYGIPWVRTGAWGTAAAGLVLMLTRLL